MQAQDKLKARGVDTIAVVSMDTPFAMNAWSKQLGADYVQFQSDPLGHLAKALGVTFHAGPLGLRSSRYKEFDQLHKFIVVVPAAWELRKGMHAVLLMYKP